MQRNRVVITGMGVVAANGNTLDAFWASLCEGRSGVGPITLFDTEGLRYTIAGEVKNFDPCEFIDPQAKPGKRMSRAAQFAVAAARMCLQDAKLDLAELKRHGETPVFMGVSTSAMDVRERPARPWSAIEGIPHAVGSSVAYKLGFNSRLLTVSNGCASGLDAVAMAVAEIRSGKSDVALAGAADSPIARYVFDCFSAARKLASRNDDPQHACRPFDRDRDGGVIAEGAGMLVVENIEHALARGALPYAEVAGYGTRADPVGAEECAGLEMAMQSALANASWRPEQVEFISAHGPGDRQTDSMETTLIKKVFGEHAYRIPVVSIKGSTGCPMGVGGMHQTIATALTIRHGKVPPTTNYENPDPDCDLDYVPGAPRRLPIARAMVTTHGFGRGNSALLLQG